MDEKGQRPEDHGRSISNALNEELMQAHLRMPAVLESMVEGREGPTDISPEEFAEVSKATLPILVKYVQALAFEVDRLRFTTKLDQEPGPFGPPEDVD
jgi:hypothetical protein